MRYSFSMHKRSIAQFIANLTTTTKKITEIIEKITMKESNNCSYLLFCSNKRHKKKSGG